MKHELKHVQQLYEDFWIENTAEWVHEHRTKHDNYHGDCAYPELALTLDHLNERYQAWAHFVISRDQTIEEAVRNYVPDIKAYMRQELSNLFPKLTQNRPWLRQEEPAAPDRRRWHSRFKEIYAERLEQAGKEKKDNQIAAEEDVYPLPKWVDGKVLPMRLPSDRKDD